MITPAFPQAPHLRNPTGEISVWYTEPPGVVLQLVVACEGTEALATWLAGPSTQELRRRFPENDDLVVILDIRPMTGRDPAARTKMIELAKGTKSRCKRMIVLPPKSFSTALLRTMEVTLSLLRVFGVNIEVAQSLNATITTCGLRPLPK